jgi:hypothetical protein
MKTIIKNFKKIINQSLKKFGYTISSYISPEDEILGYEYEKEATKCIQIVRKNTMLSKRRLVTLYAQAIYCEQNNIEGDFVECGVWKGGAMGMMALANVNHGLYRRRLHLFDAFKEICEPDHIFDGERALKDVQNLSGQKNRDQGRLQSIEGIYDSFGGAGKLEDSKRLLEEKIGYPEEYIKYHVGWFQETMPVKSSSITKIAILRLDGDWYSSTKICIEYLFDKVTLGGLIIIDDYGTYDGCKLAIDEFLEKRKIKPYLSPIDCDCRFFIKI